MPKNLIKMAMLRHKAIENHNMANPNIFKNKMHLNNKTTLNQETSLPYDLDQQWDYNVNFTLSTKHDVLNN